jgi:hypothetical protein
MAIEHRALAALSIAFIASIAAFPVLPPEIPPLWRIHGEWVFIGAPFVAFLLPITAAVIWWLLSSLNRHTAKTGRHSRSAGPITALFLSAFHVTTLIGFIGGQPWLARILGLIVGIFLIVTGSELPRRRPNPAWAAPTRAVFGNEAVWRRVHRLGGYMRVAMGSAVCLTSLSGMRGAAELIALAAGLEVVVCIAAAMFLSRQTRAAVA